MDLELRGSCALEVALLALERLDLLVDGVDVRQEIAFFAEIPFALKLKWKSSKKLLRFIGSCLALVNLTSVLLFPLSRGLIKFLQSHTAFI